MDETTVQNLLIERAKLLAVAAEKDKYRNDLRKQILSKIPKEIQDELASLDAEFDTTPLMDKANELKAQIEAGVLEIGKSVKVDNVGQAVYNNGRVTWETKGLEGLMVAVPQLATFRKIGQPYVTFR